MKEGRTPAFCQGKWSGERKASPLRCMVKVFLCLRAAASPQLISQMNFWSEAKPASAHWLASYRNAAFQAGFCFSWSVTCFPGTRCGELVLFLGPLYLSLAIMTLIPNGCNAIFEELIIIFSQVCGLTLGQQGATRLPLSSPKFLHSPFFICMN